MFVRSNNSKKQQKIFAHSNPLSDNSFDFPISPTRMDWSQHFPTYFPSLDSMSTMSDSAKSSLNVPNISFVDVGCGFGGLLFRLSELWPHKLGIGLEIRYKAVEIVKERLHKLRGNSNNNNLENSQNDTQSGALHLPYHNISVIHTNAMKFFVTFFPKQSVDCMFFCFPDPHFKEKKKRRRIISVGLLDTYAYLLKDNGIVYNITDVKELYEWTLYQFSLHPLFEKLDHADGNAHALVNAAVIDLIQNKTNEAQRVTRNKGQKYICVYRRKSNSEVL